MNVEMRQLLADEQKLIAATVNSLGAEGKKL
jgi:hypothetical protein